MLDPPLQYDPNTETKPLVAFVLLELFEDGNDGFKRGIPKMVKRTCRKEYVHCKIHPRVEDDESELGSICRNCKRYWTRNLQTER